MQNKSGDIIDWSVRCLMRLPSIFFMYVLGLVPYITEAAVIAMIGDIVFRNRDSVTAYYENVYVTGIIIYFLCSNPPTRHDFPLLN